MAHEQRVGIIMVNTGTPEAPEPRAIKKYLSQFLMDPRIRPINRVAWWLILHLCILPVRGKKNAEKYRFIWTDEGSPFVVAHEKLQNGVAALFNEDKDVDTVVRYAMSYGEPRVQSVLAEMKSVGCTSIVVLPLYPQSAYSTAGAVFDGVDRAQKKLAWDVPTVKIDNYHDNVRYIKTMAASIIHAGFNPDSDDQLLFSFHAIPLTDVERGDTYELQVGASCLQIAGELGIDRKRWTIGYQCRFDKGREWLTPTSKDVLARWAEAGYKRVFIVTPGFAVDCLETLYDIGHELKPYYQEKLVEYGFPVEGEVLRIIPCLDRSKAHAQVLYNVIAPYVQEAAYGF